MLIQFFVMKIRSVLDEVLHLDRRTEMKQIGALLQICDIDTGVCS